jgi:hypothetical protein
MEDLYTSTMVMSPAVWDRYTRWQESGGQNQDLQMLRETDTFRIIFVPQPHVVGMPISADDIMANLFGILLRDYSIGVDTRAQIQVDIVGRTLRRVPRSEGVLLVDTDGIDVETRALGGNSTLTFTVPRLDAINLDNVFDILEDRGYDNIDPSRLQLTFEFNLLAYLTGLIQGGNMSGVKGLDTMSVYTKPNGNEEWGLTPFAVPLSRYDLMSTGQRITLSKLIIQTSPPHLRDIRGLWIYRTKDIQKSLDLQEPLQPVCGIMAFLYGMEDAKRRRRESHACERFYNNIGTLYKDAVNVVANLKCDLPLRNHTFRRLIERYAPDHAVYVYDYRLMPLFIYHGSEYMGNVDQPYAPESKELSLAEWNEEFRKRICLFYDYRAEHYLPVFNLTRLFTPFSKKAKTFVENSDVDITGESEEEEEMDGLQQVRFKCGASLPCPLCHVRIQKVKMTSHRCRKLFCNRCSESFETLAALVEHEQKPATEDIETAPRWDCDDCLRSFFNEKCYYRHRLVCVGRYKEKCVHCQKKYFCDQPHQCRKYKCDRCQKWVLDPVGTRDDGSPYRILHECPIKALRPMTEEMSGKDYYAFDFESALVTSNYATIKLLRVKHKRRKIFVDDQMNADSNETIETTHQVVDKIKVYKHVVNYACSMPILREGKLCDHPTKYGLYTNRSYSLKEFWDAVCMLSEVHDTVWFAHNLKGYDGRLLVDYLESVNIAPSTLIRAGDKIMLMIIPHPKGLNTRITFKDSLLHIAAPLHAIPRMFGLDTSIVKKGFFPYKFNTPKNVEYVGRIPEKRYFDYQRMFGRQKEEFDAWYDSVKDNAYDLKENLKAYCDNDVLVLKLGLIAYRNVCLEYGQRTPLEDITIAQFTYKMYRERFMPTNTLFYLDQDHAEFARRALHGGKTDVRRMFYKQTEEEKQRGCGLRYVDIQSLYPTVQYYDALPSGRPTTTIYNARTGQPSHDKLQTFFGFIECDIRPGHYLHHPLLCAYQNKKLLAHLHPLKRIVITSVEFQAAINEAGYICEHVYRIDHYDKNTELFKPFVRQWLRLKILSGKCPADDQFEAYRAELKCRLDIDVQKEDFKPNAALRTFSKMVLNSLWGKFGQRDTLTQTTVLQNSAERFKFADRCLRGKMEEKGSRSFGDFFELKTFQKKSGFSNKNVAVASFVTAQARLRLWRVLHRLWDRVYYHDTDSVIYYYDPAASYNVPEGLFLGDWESETGDCLISEFVGLAPKTYAYRYTDAAGKRHEHVKAKGFKLDGWGQQVLTFDNYAALLVETMRTDLSQGQTPALSVPTLTFLHVNQPTPTMLTFKTIKKMIVTYRKGIVDRHTLTVFPLGYELFIPAIQVYPLIHPAYIYEKWEKDQDSSSRVMEDAVSQIMEGGDREAARQVFQPSISEFTYLGSDVVKAQSKLARYEPREDITKRMQQTIQSLLDDAKAASQTDEVAFLELALKDTETLQDPNGVNELVLFYKKCQLVKYKKSD